MTDYNNKVPDNILRYESGDIIKVGDNVTVTIGRWIFKKQISGTICFVYDPNKPSPPRGDNDFGLSIKIANGHELWMGGVDPTLALLGRNDKN